jgi:prevent-host-death family protein
MTTVGIRELRQDASRLIRQVQGGEAITVTDRGRPVARLVPIRASRLDQLVEEGRARPPVKDPLAMALPAGPEQPSGPTLTDTLVAMRDEERL